MIVMVWFPISAWAENERPSFNQSRYKEDYRFLKNPTKRTDFFDPIKYIPLNKSESLYLTLGGETRQHFESINNKNWGTGFCKGKWPPYFFYCLNKKKTIQVLSRASPPSGYGQKNLDWSVQPVLP